MEELCLRLETNTETVGFTALNLRSVVTANFHSLGPDERCSTEQARHRGIQRADTAEDEIEMGVSLRLPLFRILAAAVGRRPAVCDRLRRGEHH